MTLGLRLSFTNLDYIKTNPVPDINKIPSAKIFQPRITDLPDVISLNCPDKIGMTNLVQEKGECWLAEQALLNPNCHFQLKGSEVSSILHQILLDLKYDDVVNMRT